MPRRVSEMATIYYTAAAGTAFLRGKRERAAGRESVRIVAGSDVTCLYEYMMGGWARKKIWFEGGRSHSSLKPQLADETISVPGS